MATKTWLGGGFGWSAANRWSPAGVPGANDDESVPQPGLFEQGTFTTGSVVVSGAGSFSIQGTFSASRGIMVQGGKFATSGELYDTVLTLQGGTDHLSGYLDNVVLRGGDLLDGGSGATGPSIGILNSLTLQADPGRFGLKLTHPIGVYAQNNATLGGANVLFGVPAGTTGLASIGVQYHTLTLGPRLTLDVTGAAALSAVGTGTQSLIQNQGTIEIAGGGDLRVGNIFRNSGTIHLANGSLELNAAANTVGGRLEFENAAGKATFNADQTGLTITGFRAGDSIDLGYVLYDRTTSAALQGSNLTVTEATHGQHASLTLGDAQAGQQFTVENDGRGGTLVRTTEAQPAASVSFVDSTTGATGTHSLDKAAPGSPSYLQWQYIDSGGDTSAMSSAVPNVFLKGGSGNNAIAVTSGQNVVDGGSGSNLLTSGTGMDTFITDLGGADVWNTLVNFHAGDTATLSGFTPGAESWHWVGQAGAAGYAGATLEVDGGPSTARVTFAGLSDARAAQLTSTTGTAGGTPYLNFTNHGV